MRCPRCGTENKERARFCEGCALELAKAVHTDFQEKTISGKRVPYCIDSVDFQHPLDAQGIMRFTGSSAIVDSVRQLSLAWDDPNTKANLLRECFEITPANEPRLYQVFAKACEIMYA